MRLYAAASVVLLALLFASYSQRSTWIALGSMTLSMAALIGFILFAAARHPSQVRVPLAWIEGELQSVLDRETVAGLKSAFERAAISASAARVGAPSPGRDAMQAASTPNWLETEAAPKAISQSPVLWALDDPRARISAGSAEGVSIGGTNVSGQALEEVHAALKLDASQRELKLALRIEGQNAGDAAIPTGARFSLVSASPDEGDLEPGLGAVLTFRYIQAGQRKTSILYLTPEMISRLASGG
jgi:hypothetical protein